MNRLWVRLSLAFGAVTVVAACAIAVIGVLLSRNADRSAFLRHRLAAPDGLVSALADHHRARGSWDGVAPLLAGAEAMIPPDLSGDLALVLVDTDGRVVAAPPGVAAGEPLRRGVRTATIGIDADGRPVGALVVAGRLPMRRPGPMPPGAERARDFVERLSTGLLWLALLGGVLGVGVGVAISRGLSAPLDRLAAAARAVGARDFGQRVAPAGSAELVAVAHAFNDMAADLQRAERLRRDLVADVAHELRTPLTVLQGNLQAMLDGVYPIDAAEVGRLHDQTRVLSRLVDDLHALAQAEAGQLVLDRRPTDVAGFVEGVVAAFAPAAAAAGVDLAGDVPPRLPRMAVDPLRMAQVVQNLVANALRHTPAGGRVVVAGRAEGRDVAIEVRDTGEGIAAEDLGRVFERFYRADRARARASGGTGLGLAIARAIVQAHGGTIEAASAGVPGEGSVFTVRVPTAGA